MYTYLYTVPICMLCMHPQINNIHIHIHIYIYTYIHIYIYTYMYKHMCTCIYMYVGVYVYSYIHIYIYTDIYIYNMYRYEQLLSRLARLSFCLRRPQGLGKALPEEALEGLGAVEPMERLPTRVAVKKL